jgi:hypothetical protein
MNMRKVSYMAVCTGLLAVICIAQDVVSVVHGTVTKVDSTTKTVVVKSADGTEHAIKVTGDTTYKGAKEGLDGLKTGTEVVVRTTGKHFSCNRVDELFQNVSPEFSSAS